MTFAGVNYLAVLVAALAGFGFGALWYTLLAAQWVAAIGLTDRPKPNPLPFVVALCAQLVMAWTLAGLLGHLGEVTVGRALITAVLVWFGFVLSAMMVNHRFQEARWSLTLIDSGHWLGVLLVMGLIIGLFGT